MSKALICTVGTTVDTRNDIVDALIEEITAAQPTLVLFLVSGESRSNAQRIAEGSHLSPGSFEFVELSSSHNLNEIFRKTNDAIRSLYARGYSADDISVNYTSGTKVMGSGAVLSAVFNQCHELRYIYQGADEGERLIKTHPEVVFAFRDLQLGRQLIYEMCFQSAVEHLARINSSLLADYDVRSLEAMRHVALAYLHWDNFHPRECLNTLSKVSVDIESVRNFLIDETTAQMLERLATDIEANQYSPLVFADMMNNAHRRTVEGKLDDAVARVYRAMEMLAQWVLKAHEINTNDVDTRRIPPRYRVSFEAMRSVEDGLVRIGMRKAYDLLSILGTPLGEKFEANEELAQMLQRRGESILAHGTHRITQQECQRLISAVLDLFESEIQGFEAICRQLQFPWLRKRP